MQWYEAPWGLMAPMLWCQVVVMTMRKQEEKQQQQKERKRKMLKW